MKFLLFYKQWLIIMLSGWFRILKKTFQMGQELLKNSSLSLWILYAFSILLIILVIFPWFEYQIYLDTLEIVSIRTRKWYIFVIPAFSSILISFLMFHPYLYKIQVGINFFIIILYLYGFYNHHIHINIKGIYKINGFFYLYFFVLVFHTFSIDALKSQNNFFINQLIRLWKKKKPH